jgi:hypothetical protein
MTPDRERVLMSSELRSLLGNARGVAPKNDDPVGDTAFSAAREAMLVLERDVADGHKDHVVGTLVSIEADSSSIVVTLRVEDVAQALDVLCDLAEGRIGACKGVQVHRGEDDPVITLPIGTIERVRVTDVTSAGTCTLTVQALSAGA